MKKKICFLLVLALLCSCVLAACTGSDGKVQKGTSEIVYENEQSTDTETMLLYDFFGERFSKNEKNWLQQAAALNPYMLQSFRDRETNPWSDKLMSWFGEFPGKLLTAMAYSYRMSGETATKEAGDYLVDTLEEYQAKDGYLGVFKFKDRFSQSGRGTWDLWNHYHIALGLYFWYTETGSEKAVTLAISMLDYVVDFFQGTDENGADKGLRYVSLGAQDINLAMSHGYMLWYNLINGNEILKSQYADNAAKYYAEAKKIVDVEWTRGFCGNWLNAAMAGKEFYQTTHPRWEPLHCLMTLAELYKADKAQNYKYYEAFEKLYFSILKTDVHNSGSFSSGEQAVGNPYSDGVVETCCTIAWAEMSIVYLQLSRNSLVADEIERTVMNGALASQMATGDYAYYTYSTPANGVKERAADSLHWQALAGCIDVSCCQMNAGKIPALFGQYGYIKDYEDDKNDLYINYYGASKTNVRTKSGQMLTITQQTNYPVSGDVTFTFSLERAESINLKLRIPVWSQASSVAYNDETPAAGTAKSYFNLQKEIKDGDTVTLKLDMRAHFWQGERQYDGFMSVYHGPVLLAHDAVIGGVQPNLRREWNVADFEDMRVERGENSLLKVYVKDASGAQMTLCDFASAGQNERTYYTSWFKCNQLRPIAAGNGVTVWNNRG